MDDERPDWAKDDEVWKAYQRTVATAYRVWSPEAIHCGWAMQPKPHGSFTMRRGVESITLTAATPVQAFMSAEWLLDRLEETQP